MVYYTSGCDECDEWYHGACIGITKKDAKKIKQFFCHVCQGNYMLSSKMLMH